MYQTQFSEKNPIWRVFSNQVIYQIQFSIARSVTKLASLAAVIHALGKLIKIKTTCQWMNLLLNKVKQKMQIKSNYTLSRKICST